MSESLQNKEGADNSMYTYALLSGAALVGTTIAEHTLAFSDSAYALLKTVQLGGAAGLVSTTAYGVWKIIKK